MSIEKEGYIHDYIASGLVGVAVGLALFAAALNLMIGSATASNWGEVIGLAVVSGLFGYTSGGFVAGYLNFRLHKTAGTPMEGLGIGVVTFLIHFFITLFLFVSIAAVFGSDAGSVMAVWAISLVFAFIFYLGGGYLAGMVEHSKIPLPPFLLFKGWPLPPPPPATTQTCPTCGSPLRFIQQYQRWYCDKEQKYV